MKRLGQCARHLGRKFISDERGNIAFIAAACMLLVTGCAALGVDIGAEELFRALAEAWVEFRGVWDNGRGFEAIRKLWLARAAGLGEPVSIQASGSATSGIFESIDQAGCMIVATPDGRRVPISAGDVYFGTAKSAGAA